MSFAIDKPKDGHFILRAYSPLIFTSFYFVSPITNPHPDQNIALLVAVYFVLVALYHFMVVSKKESHTCICIVLSLALIIWVSETNQTAYAFYWFCAYFGALRFKLWAALSIFLLVCAASLISGLAFGYHYTWYYPPIFIPAVGLFMYGFYDRLDQAHQQAQALSQQKIEQLAKVAERERIARDLHDLMGHSLTSIALKAQLAEKLANNGDTNEALKEIREVAKVSSETLSQMRSVISGYKAKSLDAQIKDLVNTLEKWQFNVHKHLNIPELSAQQESTLALVLTEAVTNIIKHSNGNEVWLSTEFCENSGRKPAQHPGAKWALHIQDNGTLDKLVFGNGLNGMHERLANINAMLEINSVDGMHLAIYFKE